MILATGRRKTAIARAKVASGNGKLIINKKEMKKFFATEMQWNMVMQPLQVCDAVGKLDIVINVKGGGIIGQAGAVRHAIARALVKLDASNRGTLKRNKLLTRDPRMVERKKYGQSGARRRFQFSKR